MNQSPPSTHPRLLLTPADAASSIGVSADTLREWRQRGYGPAYVRVGKGPRARVRYPTEDLKTWSESLERHRSTGEYAPDPGTEETPQA